MNWFFVDLTVHVPRDGELVSQTKSYYKGSELIFFKKRENCILSWLIIITIITVIITSEI